MKAYSVTLPAGKKFVNDCHKPAGADGVPDDGQAKQLLLQDIPNLKHAIAIVRSALSRAGFPPGRYRYGPGQPLDPGYARNNGLTSSLQSCAPATAARRDRILTNRAQVSGGTPGGTSIG